MPDQIDQTTERESVAAEAGGDRSYSTDFFDRMEEFGFFDYVERHLPEEFVLVYEIARVFENAEHPLSKRLSPIFWQNSEEPPAEQEDRPPPPVPVVTHSEEYEAATIRTHRDIVRIYPHQFLLPDEVFYRRLAERSLMMPRPVPPRHFRYQSDQSDYAPDSRKQKVYLLLDTSSSMLQHYRIQLAKAICYFFLRENRRELGTIYFRSFDVVISDLLIADDKRSYTELIHHIVEIDTLGNGTAMDKALRKAVEDIRSQDELTEAEILMITDGAVHLDKDSLADLLGDTIRLNAVKIGSESIVPSATYIKDQVLIGDSEHSKMLRKLYDREEDVRKKLRSGAGSDQRRHQYEAEVAALQRQIQAGIEKFRQTIDSTYGHEIEELAATFVQVDDVAPELLFTPREIRVRELEGATREMLAALSDHANVEQVKQAALVHSRVDFFLDRIDDGKLELREKADELQQKLEEYLEQGSALQTGRELEFSERDQQQIRLLLRKTVNSQRRSLAVVLRIIYRHWRKKYLLWRQNRKFRR